jgi:hypothetical protein
LFRFRHAKIVRPGEYLMGTGTRTMPDSAEPALFSQRKEAAKDHNDGCQLGYPSRLPLML